MIQIDKNKFTMKGNSTQILAELTYGVLKFAQMVVKQREKEKTPITIEEVLAYIVAQIVGSTSFVLHSIKKK